MFGSLAIFLFSALFSVNALAKKAWMETPEDFIRVHYEDQEGEAVFQGDILFRPLSEERKILLENAYRGIGFGTIQRLSLFRWKKKTVPYRIDPSMPRPERILQAIHHVQSKTGIAFVSRSKEKDWLDFRPSGPKGPCSSFVGRAHGRQKVNISGWCGRGGVIHEIGHALGLYHEHTRWDRNRHLKVIWKNIPFKWITQYLRIPILSQAVGPFDWDSIMLYSSFNSSARNPSMPVMVKKANGKPWQGNRTGLSPGDIQALSKMYP